MPRPASAAAGLALALCLVLASCTDPAGSMGDDSPSSTGIRQLTVRRLPAVAQPGSTAAPAAAATGLLVASTTPARSRARITLQRCAGSRWRDLATSRTDPAGTATFPDPADGSGLRVVAARDRQVASAPLGANPWRLSFSDEFAGSSLDDQWDYRQLGLLAAASGRTVSASSKHAVQVHGGVLELRTQKDPGHPGRFLNGHVGTQASYSFRYGVAAARIKFQRPRGSHGAFWSQSPTVDDIRGDPARAGTEIDVAEYFGDGFAHGGLASYVYHYDKGGQNIKDGDLLPDAARAVGGVSRFWQRYHVYSVEWSPAGYVFRIDGRVTFHTTRAVSRRSQYLVLSLLSSDWELPALDRSRLPARMKADWVRVWQS